MTDPRTIQAMIDQIRRNSEWRENMQRLAAEKKYKRQLRKKTPAKEGEQ